MKALLVSIQPKWLKMILTGKKEFEFRNWKVPVGTVLYFYESKGKKLRERELVNGMFHHFDVFEGLGKVIAKAVVKEVYDLNKNEDYATWICKNEAKLDVPNFTGYIRQHYAIELDKVQAIEPKDVTEFVSWSKLESYKINNPKKDIDVINGRFYWTWKPEFDGDYCDMFSSDECYLTRPPQSRTWIYIEPYGEEK